MTTELEQLREQAKSLGIDVHHRHGKEKLRELIAEVLFENQGEEQEVTIAPDVSPVRTKVRNALGHEFYVFNHDVEEYISQGFYVV